jgi:cation transport ATPase
VFSRNKAATPAAPADPVTEAAKIEQDGAPSSGKGRPTPKRTQAQARNKRPLVPADRKAAAKAAREQQREERARQYQAMQQGDERYMPARDKGAQRRYVRDYVDARWNVAEFFLPVALVFVILNFAAMQVQSLALVVLAALYAVVLIAIGDAIFMWQRLKRRLTAKFGIVERGTAMYAIMRAFQIRRSRMPKPTHKKHGVWPE